MILFIVVLFFMGGDFFGGLCAEEIPVCTAKLEEVFPDLKLKEVQAMAQRNGLLYFLEPANHRIVVVKENKIVNQIGRIGQNQGELYYPRDFIIDSRDNFYVLDSVGKGDNRIQKLDHGGKYLSGFTTQPKAFGFAVNSKGKIFLGQPHLNSLISVYDCKGRRIKRFGELVLPSAVFGPGYKNYDRTHKIPMNRVNIAVDAEDNLWVSFLFMPLVLKYNRKGELLLKKMITAPQLSPLLEALLNPGSKEAKNYLSMNMDGIQMTFISKEIICNRAENKVYLLLGSDDILVLDPGGKEQYMIKPGFIKGALEKIFIKERNDIIVRFFFHAELYKLDIEESNK